MGYLNIANDMVNNSIDLLNSVINSKISTYLQGNGTPVFVTYYNIDTTSTTLDTGTYTIDKLLDDDSPLRYNRIENFPVYGLKELIPSMDELDGNLYDMNIEGEIIVLPNTIKPNAYDFIVYHYLNNVIMLQITNFEFSSIRNNDFYKLSIALKDLNNSEYIDKLEKQVVRGYTAKLDNIGTQDQCIIEDKIYIEIGNVERVINTLTEEYISTFYEKKYNSLLLRTDDFNKYAGYDPYVTKFIIEHDLLDSKDYFINLVECDNRPQVEMNYKHTIYKALEDRNLSKLEMQYMEPVVFRNVDTNPFNYFGTEVVFSTRLNPVSQITDKDKITTWYGSKQLIEEILNFESESEEYKEARPSSIVMKDNIETIVKNINTDDEVIDDTPDENIDEGYLLEELNPRYLTFIKNYLTIHSLYQLFTVEDMEYLLTLDISQNKNDFLYIPVVLFILQKYKKYLTNNK